MGMEMVVVHVCQVGRELMMLYSHNYNNVGLGQMYELSSIEHLDHNHMG